MGSGCVTCKQKTATRVCRHLLKQERLPRKSDRPGSSGQSCNHLHCMLLRKPLLASCHHANNDLLLWPVHTCGSR